MSDDIAERVPFTVPEGFQVLDWRRGFGRQIGPLYRRVGNGRVTLGFHVDEHHTNGMSNAHGGMLMTFADMAWGQIVSVEMSAFWVTVRLTCDFLSSARLGEWVEGGGEVLGRGRLVHNPRAHMERRTHLDHGDRTLQGAGIAPAEARREGVSG